MLLHDKRLDPTLLSVSCLKLYLSAGLEPRLFMMDKTLLRGIESELAFVLHLMALIWSATCPDSIEIWGSEVLCDDFTPLSVSQQYYCLCQGPKDVLVISLLLAG